MNQMVSLTSILEHNQRFVREKKYEPYKTTKFPSKKLVIVTCMDTRLTELLPQAMGLKNGDAKIVKNAGAIVSHPFGSVMRSILVAIYELQAEEVCIVGHHECGMSGLNATSILEKAKERGVEENCLNLLASAGLDLKTWLTGFHSVEESVSHSVNLIKNHPLLPKKVPVHGLVIHPETGKLDVVINGYETELINTHL
ncbi:MULTISPECIES: beta-class carbonic anhydrase [Bacillus]|uniref:carbonic anhydrase n=1 Tax=Bacillus cabrialesii subsp. tritici TaxID=2944916 RepID=A0ABT9DQ40_9BACI|nr:MULTISPECIES: carbonic anhydrase [Bacillus]MDO8226825.1 carbonic anhydrase [Bacillus cabrialesii subsp. tritici]MDU0155275.1 carbonic anhydrase [Bacillus cabrialesii]UQE78540.1 carbonic anhydrase [Bacillus cabrialesii]